MRFFWRNMRKILTSTMMDKSHVLFGGVMRFFKGLFFIIFWCFHGDLETEGKK